MSEQNKSQSEAYEEWLKGGKPPPAAFDRDWFRKMLAPEIFPLHLTWLFTLVLAVFAIFAWNDSKDTTEKIKESTKKIGEQAKSLADQLDVMRSEQEPWVYATGAIITSPIERGTVNDKPAVLADISITLKNVGKRPANSVDVIAALNFASPTDILMGNFDSGGCADNSKIGEHTSNNYVVFPEDDKVIIIHPELDDKSTANRRADKHFEDPLLVKNLFLVGCVVYSGRDEEKFHQTNFVYEFEKDNVRFPPPGEHFPAPELNTNGVVLTPDAEEDFSSAE